MKEAYVTYQDIRSLSSLDDQTVIAIKAPPETRLEVPDPTESIQIWLKSTRGPIEVFLCPEELPGSSREHAAESTESCTETEATSEASTDASLPSKKVCRSVNIKEECLFLEDSAPKSNHQGSAPMMKQALLEQADISPSFHSSLLQQTTDQETDMPFVSLEPPFDVDDNIFGFSSAGIADLFDAYEIDL
ncbi:hypothetical protein C0Q70_07945 [Pomacea canaliculata]|uniref:E2F transcription factor CC-MB domain-containing protein n=1 Tax=Pomacea canaliculata TaxID=400727 RepID=A0A2T7PGE4_POMCA|nr:hypothetical protein C0Q70_07945 [Pomacea canaliculata]